MHGLNVSSKEKTGVYLNQHRLTLAIKCAVIAAAVIALYFQDLSLIFQGALVDESSFHILAIPFIFAYLVFRKRKMVKASLESDVNNQSVFQKNLGTILGITLFAISILIYWYGSYSFTPLEFHVLTLPFLTASLVLILFNVQTLRQLIFPIAFLIFLAPPPSEILYTVGSALANLSAVASNGLANIFGLNATLTSSNAGPVITIIRPDASVLPFNVSVACSGIYSIIGFMIFAVTIAYITQGKIFNKLVILILGIPLIIALNIIRITAILGIGYAWGEDLALEVFHNFGATVLMFIGTVILLGVTEKILKKPALPTPCPTCSTTSKSPAIPCCVSCGKLFAYPKMKLRRADIAKVAGILLATVMLLSIQAPVFALTQGPPEVLVQTPSGVEISKSTSTLPEISGYNLAYSYRDTSYEQLTGNDAAIAYAYRPTSGTGLSVSVAIQIGSSSSGQHRWETCLINVPLSAGEEPTVKQLDLRDIQLQDNPPVMARYFAFQYTKTSQTEVVLYWYQTAMFNINGTAQTKSVMMSVIMYPDSPQDVSACEEQVLVVAQAVNDHWQPIKTWTSISLIISQNGLALSLGAIALFLLIALFALYLNCKEKRSLLILYNKLSAQDQLLMRAIDCARSKTLQAITSEYQKLSSTPISENDIQQRLDEAEHVGLVKKSMRNERDNPVLVWKSQLPKRGGFFSLLSF
ncbi:MAG: exosortase/archaeosortase family protein [Candidatus Bathyarchaeota archaeon]|nr:exosortase/archaeosortase family protein [Candidatus Bathyarchaeota archaeon]